ncbi:MAG: tetratricopeptide repeat protein [Planctomycetota bacterium]
MYILSISVICSVLQFTFPFVASAPPRDTRADMVLAGLNVSNDDVKAAAKKTGDAVEKASDAKQQLRKADEARRKIRGKGDERREGSENAARAYAAVFEYFPEAKAECSTAAFRFGELKRSLGLLDEARDAFRKVVKWNGDEELSARALYETGHIYRKAKEYGKALEFYRKVVIDFSEIASTRDDSLYWIGNLHAQNKDYEKAREAWRAVAERGVDALDRIRSFDKIAGSYLKEGKRDAAIHTLEEAKTALHEAASEPSSKGARVKQALERMTTIRALDKKEEAPAGKNNNKEKPVPDTPDDDDPCAEAGGEN